MNEGPPALPTVERDVVRLVVLDATGRVLLLHVRDLSQPEFGTAWELPGGGREADESLIEAARRELREETGLEIPAHLLDLNVAPTWRRDVSYTYRGMHRLQHEVILAIRLTDDAARIAGPQGVDFEREDLFETRWWAMEEIQRSSERFYPRSLPQLLARFLSGQNIEEDLEVWP